MRKVASTLRIAVLLGAVVAYSAAAFAGPATKAELAGKKLLERRRNSHKR
jgi:hypothetical protein